MLSPVGTRNSGLKNNSARGGTRTTGVLQTIPLPHMRFPQKKNISRWLTLLFKSKITRHIALGCLPVVLALLAYSGITRCGFIGLDDDLYVYENWIVSQGLTLPGIRWAFSAFHASTWQPLVWLSYMLDVSLGGVNPATLHRTNLLLHLLNIALFYACLLRLFARPRLAVFAAALFAVHPLHVESVAWIAARKDVLSTPFWWAGILAYLAYVHKPSYWRYGAVAVALTLGLMAKPMLMTLPAILLLLDVWPLRRVRIGTSAGWKTVVLEKLPLLVPVLLSFVLTVYVQTAGESILDIETISIWGRFSNAAVSVWRYVGKLLWPTSLAVLYPHPGSWPVSITLAALTATLASLAAAWWQRHRRPWLLFGLAWFLITLFPVIGLLQFGWHAMADRFMYIPATGLYIATAYALAEVYAQRYWRPPLTIALTVMFLALIARTHTQVALWRSSLSLFSHAVAITKDNWMMHNGVGAALSRDGRNDKAAPHFEAAIRIKPDRPKAYFNLGYVRFMQHRWADAVICFEKSVELHPTDKAYFNLAAAYAQNGDLPAAEKTYRTLVQRTPRHVPAIIALANLCRADGRLGKAIIIYRQALAVDPGNLSARTGLGSALLDNGHPIEGLKELVGVLREDPSNDDARKAVQRAMTPTTNATPSAQK